MKKKAKESGLPFQHPNGTRFRVLLPEHLRYIVQTVPAVRRALGLSLGLGSSASNITPLRLRSRRKKLKRSGDSSA